MATREEMRIVDLGKTLSEYLKDDATTVTACVENEKAFWNKVGDVEAKYRPQSCPHDTLALAELAKANGFVLHYRPIWERFYANDVMRTRLQPHSGWLVLWDGERSEDCWMVTGRSPENVLKAWWDALGCDLEAESAGSSRSCASDE